MSKRSRFVRRRRLTTISFLQLQLSATGKALLSQREPKSSAYNPKPVNIPQVVSFQLYRNLWLLSVSGYRHKPVDHPIEPLDSPRPNQHKLAQIGTGAHKLTIEEKIEGELAGINHRLIAIEGRLVHLQTIGTLLFAGMLASYAAILAVALRVH
jgi:hypothetical protein